MTTKEALAELKALVKQTREMLYRRIALADQVLTDLDWIAQVHGGSDLKAQDALESEFFPDLGGYVTLGKLRMMFRDVPKKTWAALKYRIQAVEIEYDNMAQPEKHETTKRTAWKQIAEERGDKLEQAERRVAALTTRVSELEAERGRLLGRIEQLEKMAGRQPALV